jgi:hypothetical protein
VLYGATHISSEVVTVTSDSLIIKVLIDVLVKYQLSLVNSDILSLGCNAVAQALAQLLIVDKSLIAFCFQFQVDFSAVVTNLLLPSVISSVVLVVLLK